MWNTSYILDTVLALYKRQKCCCQRPYMLEYWHRQLHEEWLKKDGAEDRVVCQNLATIMYYKIIRFLPRQTKRWSGRAYGCESHSEALITSLSELFNVGGMEVSIQKSDLVNIPGLRTYKWWKLLWLLILCVNLTGPRSPQMFGYTLFLGMSVGVFLYETSTTKFPLQYEWAPSICWGPK